MIHRGFFGSGTLCANRAATGIRPRKFSDQLKGTFMNGIIYIVGLVVIVIAILSFFGLR